MSDTYQQDDSGRPVRRFASLTADRYAQIAHDIREDQGRMDLVRFGTTAITFAVNPFLGFGVAAYNLSKSLSEHAAAYDTEIEDEVARRSVRHESGTQEIV